MQAFVRRHRTALALALIAVLGFIAYANGLKNGFHFDDYEGIVDNAVLRDLKNIPSFFVHPVIFRFTYDLDWRPILQITYALNYAIHGADPMVFHATDLLFHIAGAWMIFLIVRQILEQSESRAVSVTALPIVWIALAPAVLFVVHTVNTQTVNYSWARSSLLAALFYMIAVYCHLRGPFNARSAGGARWHAAALIAFALGLGTKATVVSLPGMLIVYEALFLNPTLRNPVALYIKEPRRLLKHLPTAAVLIAYVWLRVKLIPRVTYQVIGMPWAGSGGGGGRKAYLLTQLRAWVYYLKLYLWPDPLIFDYSGFGWSTSFFDARVLVSAAIVAAIVVGAWLIWKRDPLLAFGAAWFFIALLPEASVFVRPDEVTGHRPYLAYAGLSIAAVLFAVVSADSLRRLRRASWPDRRFAIACGAALAVTVAALTAATMRRNLDWRDDIVLWNDVLRKDPGNIRALNVLGIEYAQLGDYALARQLLDEAIRATPGKAETYLRRGTVNMLVGDYDAALADLNFALAKKNWLVLGYIYRGDVYRATRRYEEAEKDYRTALGINASALDAYYGIALINWERKRLPEATAACRKLLELERDNPRGYLCLGSLLMHQGMFGDAMKVYYNGVSRFPESGTLWYGLGTAYEELGLYKEAQHSYERSSQLAQESGKNSGGSK